MYHLPRFILTDVTKEGIQSLVNLSEGSQKHLLKRWSKNQVLPNNVNLFELAWKLANHVGLKDCDTRLRSTYELLFNKQMCLEKSTPREVIVACLMVIKESPDFYKE